MALRTVTYDDSTHKIVPRESTDQWIDNLIVKNGAPSIEMARSTMQGLINELLDAAPEYQEPDHPLDTPLPCDIRIGAGTIKKGSKLSVLVHRMNVLYQLAMKTQLGICEPANQEPTKDER